MFFVMNVLSQLRGKIPFFFALSFAGLTLLFLFNFHIRVNSDTAATIVVVAMVVGYIIGIIVRRFTPDPDDKGI